MNTRFYPCLLRLSLTAGGAEFFVSPGGNDANGGTKDKPFATLGRAQQAARASAGKEPMTVWVQRINGQPARSVRDLLRLQNPAAGKALVISFVRGQKRQETTIGVAPSPQP